MEECNIRGWENPFECPNGLICATIGFTEKTLIDVRNRLQQKGFITFEAGNKKAKSPVYTLLCCNKVSKNDSKTVSKNDSKTVSKKVNIIYKTKTKTKTEKINKKEIEIFDELDFGNAWILYGKKGNEKTSKEEWGKMENDCKVKALNHIPLYVASTPEEMFRKNFETYLNKECWNDKIIEYQQKNERLYSYSEFCQLQYEGKKSTDFEMRTIEGKNYWVFKK